MNRTGIPTKPESALASARAAGRKRNDTLRRLVRVTGPDAGVYTIPQIAQRLQIDALSASRAVWLARHGNKPVTWARIVEKAQRAEQASA